MNVIVKVAPGHYRVVEYEQSGPLGGRPVGKGKPVPKRLQVAGIKYCSKCNRRLNKNNKSGLCKVCNPHGRPKLPG